jgi:hypothetical protein
VISLKESPGGLGRGRFEQELQAQVLRISSEKEHLVFSRNPQGGGIDGQDSQRKTAKSRQPLDLGKLRTWFKP